MKANRLFRLLAAFLLLAAIVFLAFPVKAAPPNGVDHLRGRWDGVIENLFGADQPFRLLLDRSGPDPDDSQAALYNGCMAVGEDADFAPVSARVVILGNEEYDLTLFGTATGGAGVIKLTGLVQAFDAAVTDDVAGGEWQTAEETGNWSVLHHDRRQVKCPEVEVGDDLIFHGDVYGIVGIAPVGEENSQGTLLESFTNIVSTGVRVDLPGGGSLIVPYEAGLFSPLVDFISEFRFFDDLEGLPIAGQTYTFTLLDVFGQPIPGATSTDIWLSCALGAPRNVAASVNLGGMSLSWDPVSPVAGFDPGGFPPLGFYQIELYAETDWAMVYGSNGIHSPSHLIPAPGFGGFAPGTPDGFDFGQGLLELADGAYVIDTIAFAEAVHAGGSGLECQVRAWEEQVRFELSGGAITILP